MKKKLETFLSLSMLFTLSACNNSNVSSSTTSSNENTSTKTSSSEKVSTSSISSSVEITLPNDNVESLPKVEEDVGFAIHYHRKDAKYTKWNLWLWENGGDGADYSFTGLDDYGAVARYTFEDFSLTALDNGIGFIVKEAKTWAEGASKDVEEDRFMDFSTLSRDEYGYYNIYLESQVKGIYVDSNGKLLDVIQYFDIAYNKVNGYTIWFQTNNEFEEYSIYQGDKLLVSNETDTDNENIVTKTKKKISLKLGQELPNIIDDYILTVKFKESQSTLTKEVNKAVLFKTEAFSELYTYDGELGAIYSSTETTFRVWSPLAKSIKLRVYETGTPASVKLHGADVVFPNGSDSYQEYDLVSGEKGTWEVVVNGDLAGKYYTYVVTNSKFVNAEIVDPYAKSTGINGLRGMIVDFSKTNPEGWDDVKLNGKTSTELVVYETHIADLTSSSTWNGTKENAKTYKGFYEEGTKYEGVTTGFDHIKELGVNAVQIIPIFDQANDERQDSIREDGTLREFNWGYNPLNYNALEGIYSLDPFDGYTKIREFKELVQAYSNAGINIIMDVVYNHVSGLDRSNFDVLMPNYYFRYVSGKPSNGSGCGNETASEMPMFRKFMIDSSMFWAKEYKLGGFRFDLMGLHDIETMNLLTKNLHENVDPTIAVYGEPWAGGTSALGSPHVGAMQVNMSQYDGYGCFNDKFRDGLIKGGLNAVTAKGWVTNNETKDSNDIPDIVSGIQGRVLKSSATFEPEKCINYVTCHDNYTLYDRIKASGIEEEDVTKKMAMLANSVVLTSQGTSFMLAGEEFLRTKGGNENSYNASYEVNELNYALKVQHNDMFENYKKLIALNLSTDLFSKNGEECALMNVEVNEESNVIVYSLVDTLSNREYKIVHSNGFSGELSKVVDLAGYSLYLDTLNVSGLELTNETVISEYQTIIAYKNL